MFYQIALQIILLLMTATKTSTTSGLQTYFQQNTILGIDPSIILGFSIAWSLRTSITLHVKTIKRQKICFGFKQSFFVGLWSLLATLRRVLSIVCFFLPSLGQFNILYHWISEQYYFSMKKKYKLIHPKDEVHLFNMTEKLLWSELDRWNYYADVNEPTEPSYTLYTGFNLKWTFVVFLMLQLLHFVIMFGVKLAMSMEFRKGIIYNKCIHILQNINLSFPWADWDEGMFTREEFLERYKNTENEMACSIAVNAFFSICMLFPIWFTGNTTFDIPFFVLIMIIYA